MHVCMYAWIDVNGYSRYIYKYRYTYIYTYIVCIIKYNIYNIYTGCPKNEYTL